ncbi:hypothetical protein B0H12DRAFT_743602 [Mycena haematopus]|nr:hypothetical protein B0H12DRAFT_743602 [Mycena haematopus]
MRMPPVMLHTYMKTKDCGMNVYSFLPSSFRLALPLPSFPSLQDDTLPIVKIRPVISQAKTSRARSSLSPLCFSSGLFPRARAAMWYALEFACQAREVLHIRARCMRIFSLPPRTCEFLSYQSLIYTALTPFPYASRMYSHPRPRRQRSILAPKRDVEKLPQGDHPSEYGGKESARVVICLFTYPPTTDGCTSRPPSSDPAPMSTIAVHPFPRALLPSCI